MTLSELANRRDEIRELRRAISAEDKTLGQELEEIDRQLLEQLDEQGLTRMAIDGLSISVTEEIVPSDIDWDTVWTYVRESGNTQLLQRRLSSAAYRELLNLNGTVPGTQPYTKRGISMRRG